MENNLASVDISVWRNNKETRVTVSELSPTCIGNILDIPAYISGNLSGMILINIRWWLAINCIKISVTVEHYFLIPVTLNIYLGRADRILTATSSYSPPGVLSFPAAWLHRALIARELLICYWLAMFVSTFSRQHFLIEETFPPRGFP